MTRQEWQVILNNALNGDTPALGRICEEYLKPQMKAFVAKKFKGQHDEAEDVIQDVFNILSAHYSTIEERDLKSFTAFVFRMTTNKCIDVLRQQKKRTGFMLTEQSFDLLQQRGMAEEVAARLRPLENVEVIGQHNFIRRLKHLLSVQEYRQYKTAILQSAIQDRYVAEMPENPADQHIDQLAYLNEQAFEELINEIRTALRPEEWELLWQHDVEGLAYRELAERSGFKLGTLHARHERILKTLQCNETLRELWNDLQWSFDVPQTTSFALRIQHNASRHDA